MMIKRITGCFLSLLLALMLLASCGTSATPHLPTSHHNVHPILLDSLHMFDPTHGWAVSENDQIQIEGIVRTSDGGQTWQDMTPASYSLHWPTANFLSPLVAWLVMPQTPNGPTQIIRTTDGGQSWQGQIIATGSYYSRLFSSFLDSQHGWLLTSADNDQTVDIWRTTNGQMWQHLSHITPLLPPNSQLQITGMTFLNPSTGWISGVPRPVAHGSTSHMMAGRAGNSRYSPFPSRYSPSIRKSIRQPFSMPVTASLHSTAWASIAPNKVCWLCSTLLAMAVQHGTALALPVFTTRLRSSMSIRAGRSMGAVKH